MTRSRTLVAAAGLLGAVAFGGGRVAAAAPSSPVPTAACAPSAAVASVRDDAGYRVTAAIVFAGSAADAAGAAVCAL